MLLRFGQKIQAVSRQVVALGLLAVLLLAPRVQASCENSTVTVSDETNVARLPLPNRVRWILSNELPTDAPITAAYVLAQQEGKVLIARHRERGWDIPGGHVEANESPEAAALREAFEETGATVQNLRLLAYQKIEILGPRPENYAYPYPLSYQALYVGEIAELGVFPEGDEDTVERGLFGSAEAHEHVGWVQRNPGLFAQVQKVLFELTIPTVP